MKNYVHNHCLIDPTMLMNTYLLQDYSLHRRRFRLVLVVERPGRPDVLIHRGQRLPVLRVPGKDVGEIQRELLHRGD